MPKQPQGLSSLTMSLPEDLPEGKILILSKLSAPSRMVQTPIKECISLRSYKQSSRLSRTVHAPSEDGIAIAQRIKATLGITGLSLPRVHIDGVVWHLDVCLLYTSIPCVVFTNSIMILTRNFTRSFQEELV